MVPFNNNYVFCLDDFLFGHYKKQITDLILIINKKNIGLTSVEYTRNDYSIMLSFFENLKHLSIVSTENENYIESINNYPRFSLNKLAPTIFSSSTLTKLCIHVIEFDDCLALLDGRLKQLTVFVVEVAYIREPTMTNQTRVSLCSAFFLFSINI
jgi:hypothetical protein